MNLSESYKKRLSELAGTKLLVESSIVKDKLNALTFKKDVESIGGKLYAVGGINRDEILGKQSKDLDILITGVPLDRLEHILINHGKVKEVGKSFGIIKFVPFGETEDIDIAIPRTERKISAGYQGFEVTSDHTLSIEDDLLRRDLTINSLAQDSDGNIIDPFGGLEDIKNKIIRVTNEKSFGDDPLRMIRCVSFSARFGFTIEPNTLALIKKNAHKIKEISPERILIEFDKIIKKGNPQVGIDNLINTGLFKEIFGFDYSGDKDFSKVKTMADFIYKIFENSGQIASSFYKHKLKGETNSVNQISALELQEKLSNNKLEDRKIVQRILNISPDIEESGLLKDDTKAIMKTFKNGLYPLNIKGLDINGNDLISMGYKKEEIGKNNNLIMQAVLSDELANKKEDIIKFIEDKNKKPDEAPKKEDDDKDAHPDSVYSIKEARKIVRKILFESLIEEEYPVQFDMNVFKSLKTFKERIEYCQNNLKRLNSGSSRIVYQVNKGKVLKLAKNKKGIEQNETEIDRGSGSYFSSILAQVFDSHPDGLWVEMELAIPINKYEFRRLTEFKIEDVGAYLINFQDKNNGKKAKYHQQKPLVDRLDNDEFVQQLREFVAGTDALAGDLGQASSYGVVRRNNEDTLVLIDYGITTEIYKDFYAESTLNESIPVNNLSDYKKWKRKNVTIRGISNLGEFNGAGASLGDGLYTAFLSNKEMAKKYGGVHFVVNARPKNPKIFDSLNRAEIWLQQNVYFKNHKNVRDFFKDTTIENEVQKMGYDGIEVTGREIVNYKPENVKYFKTENELINYYENL